MVAVLFLVVLYVSKATALYEDQAGSIDWSVKGANLNLGVRLIEYHCCISTCRYQQYVGPVSYLSLDGVTIQGCKRLLVASERGVVAAIHAETGDIGVRACLCY